MSSLSTNNVPLRLAFLLGPFLGTGCDGSLDPLEAVPIMVTPRPAVEGLHVVEPFDYHYPDEPFFDDVAPALELSVARGQTEAAALVYVSDQDGELRLEPSALTAASGEVLPASVLRLGVVTFADRTRSQGGIDTADRLSMAYVSGARRAGASGDYRGYAEDARERLPVVPLVIVPDSIELENKQPGAVGWIELDDVPYARARGARGLGTEFWITVTLSRDVPLSAPTTRFEGELRLSAPSGEQLIAISVEALDFELDALESHDHFVGVTDGLRLNPSEFRGAILSDLREHGCNLLRDDFESLADYQEAVEAGLALLVNTSPDFDRADIPAISELGVEPWFNVGLFEPTREELDAAVARGEALRAAGALLESEMTLEVARSMQVEVGMDAWTYALTTYELSDLHAGEFDDFLDLLDVIRADPSMKEVRLSGHYAEVFNGHVPHQARLMYGLWLERSQLDFGMAYGYAMVDGQNPFTTSTYNGVAFPAKLLGSDGRPRPTMLPSLTWEAFRAGIDDFRYAVTAARVAAGDPVLAARVQSLLEPYASLYDAAGDRVDYRNREADVRRTRAELARIIVDAR